MKNIIKYGLGIAAIVGMIAGGPKAHAGVWGGGRYPFEYTKPKKTEVIKLFEQRYENEGPDGVTSDYSKLYDMLSKKAVFISSESGATDGISPGGWIFGKKASFLYTAGKTNIKVCLRRFIGPSHGLSVWAFLEEGSKDNAERQKKIDSLRDLIQKTIAEQKKPKQDL